MTKRIIQSVAILLISILNIGGLLFAYASLSNSQPSSFYAHTKLSIAHEQVVWDGFEPDLQWHKGKKVQHPLEGSAIEKVEENDLKPSTDVNDLTFPLFAALLHKNIAFSLFSLLYNSNNLTPPSDQLITCYDSGKFILYQDFRI